MAECSKSGYWCCQENSYNYGCATAYAKVYWRFVDEKGNIIGWNETAIENLYVEIQGTGDTFYLIEGASSWDEYTWGENGCSGPHVYQVSLGLTLLCPAGYIYKYPVACGAWDKDYCGYDWAWTRAARGWVGTGDFFNITVVPEYQYYSVDGNPLNADIYEGVNYLGTAPMTLILSWTNHSLTFKKAGYYDQTINVGTEPDGDIIYITYSLTQLPPSIKETISWEGIVPSGSHPFYLFSFYGVNTNNTLAGFQIEKGTSMTASIISPGQSRQDYLITPNVSQFDCLTIIAEYYDGSTGQIGGIYDARIQNSII